MKQNIYDDPDFFSKYANLPRSQEGLEAAMEWTELRKLLPDLKGIKVLDLGCGYGWHCRYLKENGASSVLGIDLSSKMLEKAQLENAMNGIEYRQGAIEDLSFCANEFDLVFSSLAFHYVKDFNSVCKTVFRMLKPRGHFTFSIEHPIFTSHPSQDWLRDSAGHILGWPVDNYFSESERQTAWLTSNVIKYHRTISSIINSVILSGFSLQKVVEPSISKEILDKNPEWADENKRPVFLLISAVKN